MGKKTLKLVESLLTKVDESIVEVCESCRHVDKQSRVGVSFVCTKCGHVDHADINAARNIALKGTESLNKLKRSGSVNVLSGIN